MTPTDLLHSLLCMLSVGTGTATVIGAVLWFTTADEGREDRA